MPCKAPAFWWTNPGLTAQVLRLVAQAYRAISVIVQKNAVPYKPLVPVICVGNVVTGGAGKTPAVQAIAGLLHDAGITKFPAIVLRGYGGKLQGPTAVDPHAHGYKDVGDEALLHAACAPTIIAKDRAAGVKLAQLSGADFVLMDDGLQNPSVIKTVSFLTVDAAQGIGNGLMLPAGPLREPLDAAMKKTDAIILIGDTLPFATNKPVFRARIAPVGVLPAALPYLAFAGLGRPEKFLYTLKQIGAQVIDFHPFADHYAYADTDIERLIAAAEEKRAALITTEKDYMRIPGKFRDRITYLPVQMVFDDPAGIVRFIRDRLMAA